MDGKEEIVTNWRGELLAFEVELQAMLAANHQRDRCGYAAAYGEIQFTGLHIRIENINRMHKRELGYEA